MTLEPGRWYQAKVVVPADCQWWSGVIHEADWILVVSASKNFVIVEVFGVDRKLHRGRALIDTAIAQLANEHYFAAEPALMALAREAE